MNFRVAWVNFVMCACMLFLCTSVGFLLYAKYGQCDPLQAKLISKPDQVRYEKTTLKVYLFIFILSSIHYL